MRIRHVLGACVAALPAIAGAQNPRPQIDQQLLEQQVRVRAFRALKEQVGLTDAQMARVQEVHARIEERRQTLLAQERQARAALRDEILVGDTARTAAGQLLDQLLKAQRERYLLPEDEHKELSHFMTPLQRAKYFSIEETLRRIIRGMMEQSADSAAAAHAGRGGKIPAAGTSTLVPRSPVLLARA